MQLLVLLCCVAAAARAAPTASADSHRRTVQEAQHKLTQFIKAEGLKQDESSAVSLSIKPGCYKSTLGCFHGNLLNLTVTSTKKHRDLCSYLKKSTLKSAVSDTYEGAGTDNPLPSCRSCDSFPKTAVELVQQLKMFLQMGMSRL
ncbi:unnamed protein product [Merluccius merluccius]